MDTPFNGLYGEAPAERGTFVRVQLYGRVGISLVEVYKRVGKFVVAACDRGYRSFRYRVVSIQLYSFEV